MERMITSSFASTSGFVGVQPARSWRGNGRAARGTLQVVATLQVPRPAQSSSPGDNSKGGLDASGAAAQGNSYGPLPLNLRRYKFGPTSYGGPAPKPRESGSPAFPPNRVSPDMHEANSLSIAQNAWHKQLNCADREAQVVMNARQLPSEGPWPTSATGLAASAASLSDEAGCYAGESPVEVHKASEGWFIKPHHLSPGQLWERIRDEARADAAAEPALASFLYSAILSHKNIDKALAFILANKLSSPTLLGVHLLKLFSDVYEEDEEIVASGMADAQAVMDRDPACERYTQVFLYFKGFQAIQAHRIAHRLWRQGRHSLALALASRVSEVFHVDIHPAAQIGRGILVDHATGVVIGETAVVGDNCSILHHVTLGGSGTGRGIRHPKIGHGVLLGAGVCVLGPVTVGDGAKIGAGSVVVQDVPEHSVAVGVPARIVKRELKLEPVDTMDQCLDFIYDYVI